MSGDWIKMRIALAEDPAVIAMAAHLGELEFTVVGRLHHLWGWADVQSRDGHAPGVTNVWIDRYVQRDGFAQAMVEVGWLVIDGTGVSFPKFGRHNGKSAKERGLAAERKQNQREKVTQDAGQMSRSQRDMSETREEKRRSKKHMSGKPDDAAIQIIEYLNAKAGTSFKPVDANLKLVTDRMAEGATAEVCCAVIDAKVAEWKSDAKMDQYLRPSTLFNAEKFAAYSGQLGCGNAGHEWWKAAGFDKDWQATNAGCTAKNAYLWRDGQRIKEPA
jgi:uncharacterized phage protein (TIGR02220 family)